MQKNEYQSHLRLSNFFLVFLSFSIFWMIFSSCSTTSEAEYESQMEITTKKVIKRAKKHYWKATGNFVHMYANVMRQLYLHFAVFFIQSCVFCVSSDVCCCCFFPFLCLSVSCKRRVCSAKCFLIDNFLRHVNIKFLVVVDYAATKKRYTKNQFSFEKSCTHFVHL